MLGCDVLGVSDGAGAAAPAPPDGDAGGAAVCALLETVKIRKHAENSATANQLVFGFMSHTPNFQFRSLEKCTGRWGAQESGGEPMPSVIIGYRHFSRIRKNCSREANHVAALGVKDALVGKWWAC